MNEKIYNFNENFSFLCFRYPSSKIFFGPKLGPKFLSFFRAQNSVVSKKIRFERVNKRIRYRGSRLVKTQKNLKWSRIFFYQMFSRRTVALKGPRRTVFCARPLLWSPIGLDSRNIFHVNICSFHRPLDFFLVKRNRKLYGTRD